MERIENGYRSVDAWAFMIGSRFFVEEELIPSRFIVIYSVILEAFSWLSSLILCGFFSRFASETECQKRRLNLRHAQARYLPLSIYVCMYVCMYTYIPVTICTKS